MLPVTLRRARAAVLLSALAFAVSTHAGEPEQLELARASALLEQAATTSSENRTAAIAIGATSVALLAPTGAVLLTRDGDLPNLVGKGLTASAGGALVATLLSLRSSPAERLRDALSTRRAAGMDDAELLRATEADFGAAAVESASNRRLFGMAESLLGGALAVGGCAILLIPNPGGLSDRAHYSLGSMLAGTGAPFLGIGLHALLVQSPIEIAWSAYGADRAGDATNSASSAFDLNVSPAPGGGALLAQGRF